MRKGRDIIRSTCFQIKQRQYPIIPWGGKNVKRKCQMLELTPLAPDPTRSCPPLAPDPTRSVKAH